MERLERAAARVFRAAIASLIAAYALLFSAAGILQYRFYTPAFDLPIFAQAVDGLLRGTLFVPIRGMVWLGDHSSWILFLLAPLYAVFRHPVTLVVVQSVALALGAIPAARLARRVTGSAAVGLSFAALYLAYPALGYSNLFEFHPEVLCTPILLATIDALEDGRFLRGVAFGVLALLGKEDVALVVGGLAVWAVLRHGRRAIPAAGLLAGVAAASLVISFAVLKPHFNTGEASYSQMYAAWGASPGAMASRLLRHPLAGVRALFDTAGSPADGALKRATILEMLAPLVFLPLASPLTFAIVLPIVAEHFLSNRTPQHSIVCQYTALITPFLFAAAALGLARLAGGRRPRAVGVALAALTATAIASAVYGPLWGFARERMMPTLEPVLPSREARLLAPHRDALMRRVGRPAHVVAGFEYLARFTSSPDSRSLHHIVLGRYTYSPREYPIPTGMTALIANLGNAYVLTCVDSASGARLRRLIALNRLVPVASVNDDVLFIAGARDSAELVSFGATAPRGARRVTFDDVLTSLGGDVPRTTEAGAVLPIRSFWRRAGAVRGVYQAEFMLSNSADSACVDVTRMIGYLIQPVADWPAGAVVRETYRLALPRDLPAGAYALGVRIEHLDGERVWSARPDDPDVADNDSTLVLAHLVVRRGRR